MLRCSGGRRLGSGGVVRPTPGRSPAGFRSMSPTSNVPSASRRSFATTDRQGHKPVVVLLHGVEGGKRFVAQRRRTADQLRRQGYATFIVHYFDAVDYDDLWVLKDDGQIDTDRVQRVSDQDAEKWTEAVANVIDIICDRPDVDRTRLAIDGYSLGGFRPSPSPIVARRRPNCLTSARWLSIGASALPQRSSTQSSRPHCSCMASGIKPFRWLWRITPCHCSPRRAWKPNSASCRTRSMLR